MAIMSTETTPQSHPSAAGSYGEPPARRGSWVRAVVYLVLLCGLGVVVWRVYHNHELNAQNSARQAAALLNRPVPVQVTPVAMRPMPIYLSALGTVTPYNSVTVKARVSGELLPVKFTEGQLVREGDTIMVIDPKPYQAALDQAKGTLAHDEALLKNAQAEYSRYKALFDAGVVSKETLDSDEASMGQYQGAIQADKAAIETTELQLSWCTIKSPITGRIGLRLVDAGNIITANTTNLVVINQFQPISVYFTLPENELPQVLQKLAADRQLPVDAYDHADTQRLATGQLLTADNQIDTTTGTDKLKAVFSNSDNRLFPDQFVNIHLVMENRPRALVVPSAAIQSGIHGSYVWVAAADAQGPVTVKMQPVRVALAQGQVTILDDGVSPGDRVVVDGADRLREGATVLAGDAQPRDAGGPTGPFGSGSGAQPGGPAEGAKSRAHGQGSSSRGNM
jgi:multidrug efflux system membrane fusion protein